MKQRELDSVGGSLETDPPIPHFGTHPQVCRESDFLRRGRDDAAKTTAKPRESMQVHAAGDARGGRVGCHLIMEGKTLLGRAG